MTNSKWDQTPSKTSPTDSFWVALANRPSFMEFLLVIIMLIVLSVLVVIVLSASFGGDNTAEFRRNILSLIITAFGAWIGAGAAYFFGKENLRVATQSMIDIGKTPKERLEHTSVKDFINLMTARTP